MHPATPEQRSASLPGWEHSERAARAANTAWAVASWRAGARSARQRLDQLRAAGRIHDEAYFARLGR